MWMIMAIDRDKTILYLAKMVMPNILTRISSHKRGNSG